MLNIFGFSQVYQIVKLWLLYANKFSQIDQGKKAKLAPASFSSILELYKEKKEPFEKIKFGEWSEIFFK